MAVEARDGSMHHSAGRAKLHNEMNAGKPAKKAATRQAPAGGGKTHPAPSPHSIEDHVATHGPAVEIHVVHDKATGKHHVVSHHGENGTEKHFSDHDSPESAHAAMATAMGMNEGVPDEETPTPDVEPEQQAASSQGGGGIPGLA